MKTLTITDAKKNLGRWLQSAARGEDVGIICAADIIALRKVEVTPVRESFRYGRRQEGPTIKSGRSVPPPEPQKQKEKRKPKGRRPN